MYSSLTLALERCEGWVHTLNPISLSSPPLYPQNKRLEGLSSALETGGVTVNYLALPEIKRRCLFNRTVTVLQYSL